MNTKRELIHSINCIAYDNYVDLADKICSFVPLEKREITELFSHL